MVPLQVLANEFVAVVKHCIEKEKGIPIERKRKYAIEKLLLCELLDKNMYAEAAEKLELWKRLRWIDCEDRRITKRVYLKETKTYRRFVVVDLGVHQILEQNH
ncbi:MAG TPA: hypothetical protein DEQ02_02400 [Ruminococcaceae bacterium]|nr:hypothetical protein [Oscillospiraceae bacterium]